LRNLPVPSIDVVFSKAIKVSTFDFNDVQLVRDGSANLITSGITITQLTPSSFRIGGLGSLTADSGNYSLILAATGITDTSDNAGIGQLAINWTQDTVAPTIVSLEKVTTNPRNTVVPSLDVKFSEAIDESTFNYNDITLSRNGGANIITSQTKVTKIDATTYRITDFSFVSGAEGSYTLTVNGSGIRDAAGNAGLGSASSSWVMDTTKPAVPITFAITPDLGKSTTDGLTSTQKVTLSGVLLETNLSVRVFDVTANADLGLAVVTNKTFTKALELAGGPHRLRIRAIDAAGNLSDETFFDVFIDLAGPTALITAVTPDPIDAAVPSVDITFSEALNDVKFTREDLQLTRNGGTNLINSQVQIQFVGTNTYRVAGLSTLTADGGLYALTLDLTGIEDAAGNTGKDSVTTTWRRLGANTAPVLSAIPPQIVSAENPLVVTNTAFDADIPANKLTFSFGAGAPSGATINATNGVFAWTPSRSQAGQTFNITITVTDDGTPALSDSKVLNISVTDFAELNLGRTVVRSGDRGSVPVEFFGSAPVSQFNFLLSFRTNYLTNITVDALVPEVGTATVQKLSASQYMVRVQARSGNQFSTRANVVEIGFNAFTNRTSAFIPLQLSNTSVTKSDNTQITRVFTKNGRVVVVDAEPLLEGLIQTNGNRALIVYGKASSTYQVQSSPTLNGGTNWTETGRLTLPGLFDTFQLQTQTNRVLFYRAIEKP
jgi:hypothetical protein